VSLFVGLDIGTSGAKCLIVDDEGRQAGFGSQPWSYRWEGLGMCELDPNEAYGALAAASRQALEGLDAAQVVGIGVTSQRNGIVLLDERGAELHAGPNADGRGAGTGIELEREHGERVYRISGRLPVMLYLPARLGWFRANRPEVLAQTRWAVSFSDWLVYRLTGTVATEPTQAAEMLVYDLAGGRWSEELCEVLGVPASLLPEIRSPGEPAGALRADAAEEFGLPSNVATVAGGSDTQCAALAAGAIEPGHAVVVAGSTMFSEQVVAEPRIDEERRLWTSPHPAGAFVVDAWAGEAGAAVDWMANLMKETPAWVDEAAASSEPGAGGVFFLDVAPSRAGDFTMLRPGELTFPSPLLAMARSREDVARSVLEGVAFAAKAGLEWTQDVAGPPTRCSLTGGLARSRTLARILASALGSPISVATQPNGTALGAAIVASVAGGEHGSVAEAAKGMADPGEEVDPEASWAGPTATAYAGWRERAQRLDENAMRVGHMIGPR
jgi:xylulokinase